jgi:hypothetical protein
MTSRGLQTVSLGEISQEAAHSGQFYTGTPARHLTRLSVDLLLGLKREMHVYRFAGLIHNGDPHRKAVGPYDPARDLCGLVASYIGRPLTLCKMSVFTLAPDLPKRRG